MVYPRLGKNYRVIYKRGPSTVAWFLFGLAILSWSAFILLSSYPVLAYVYYLARPATSALLSLSLRDTTLRSNELRSGTAEVSPVKDVSLPEGHYMSIPVIGVDSVLWEASLDNYEVALKKGVWRVPDFGIPGSSDKPMILAAHRFGYVAWTQNYRVQNSFFNLPKLVAGDRIEVIWDQRRYEYQVERVVEGTAIDDYSGDLILYTCKFLVSPLRYFVYARLVN